MDRKLIIKRITFFILPIIIVAIISEIVIQHIPNDYRFKNENLLRQRQKIKILTLGASHTFYGIKPELFDSTMYNMAYVSQTLLFDNLILKKYIDTLPNLKAVIIPISYASLSQKYSDGEEMWRKFNYFRYYEIEPPFGKWYQKYYLEIFNIPSKKNMIKLFNYISGKCMYSCDTTGWCNTFAKVKVVNIEKSAKRAAKRHENGVLDFTQNLQYLQEIIDVCGAKQIKVYLVIFPFWKTYRENLDTLKFNKIIKTCLNLDNKFKNVQFFNYSNDPDFQSNKDFNDADHLSVEGAIKFSTKFNTVIKENWNK